ncbi:MAG: bifunctional nuclease family protein, partial [Gemmatimonadetes bacterium]|nr:bifunctional nuclease family protein [Gemmatimonadota bacterium]
ELLIQRGPEVFSIDARPSDSIAIALRLRAPVFTTDDLLSISSIQIESAEEIEVEPEPEEPEGLSAEQLKEYLKKLNPEDLGRFNP